MTAREPVDARVFLPASRMLPRQAAHSSRAILPSQVGCQVRGKTKGSSSPVWRMSNPRRSSRRMICLTRPRSSGWKEAISSSLVCPDTDCVRIRTAACAPVNEHDDFMRCFLSCCLFYYTQAIRPQTESHRPCRAWLRLTATCGLTALNCSVKALNRLQTVRGRNSS